MATPRNVPLPGTADPGHARFPLEGSVVANLFVADNGPYTVMRLQPAGGYPVMVVGRFHGSAGVPRDVCIAGATARASQGRPSSRATTPRTTLRVSAIDSRQALGLR